MKKENLLYRQVFTTVLFPSHDHEGVIMSHICSCDCDNQELDIQDNVAAEYDFMIQKGDSLDFTVQYLDPSKKPFDLTGCTARLVAQYQNKVFTPSVRVEDPENGMLRIFMTPYETSKIFTLDYKYNEFTRYTYNLNIISSGNMSFRILQGIICVSPSTGAV